ncbi:MAG TPA: hypothetical protein VMS77_09555 [Conexivisphaerales archaeon]|nr:hypothetical protein [Conexivisphaerales archaeon]
MKRRGGLARSLIIAASGLAFLGNGLVLIWKGVFDSYAFEGEGAWGLLLVGIGIVLVVLLSKPHR